MKANKETYEKVYHAQYNPKECMTLEGHPQIKGYDFEKKFNLEKFIEAYSSTGLQATNLGKGVQIIKAMRREKATIFLSFTSNMISSGVREAITYLVKHKKVDVIVTSCGAIEEDIMKTMRPFVIGDFSAPGATLFENGVNRIGNIFVPNDRYAYLDKFMQELFPKVHELQNKQGKPLCPMQLCREIGNELTDESSFLYWAAKNDIPVFCPGIVDGAVGDLMFFYKQSNPDFLLDVTQEIAEITKIALNAQKTGIIALGGGISKHFALNANIFREGVDYAVYVNTAIEHDGSDSGGNVQEAITWGKVKTTAPNVKIFSEASIVFPLLVAATFTQEKQ